MITYRKAEQKDKKDFIEMERNLYKYYNDLGVNKYLNPISYKDIPEKVFEDYFNESFSKNFFFVAENESKVIGHVIAVIASTFESDCYEIKYTGHIESLFVLEEFRGQGTGKELIDKAIEWFKSQKINVCTLNVRTENTKALELYKKIGFKKSNIKMWKEI